MGYLALSAGTGSIAGYAFTEAYKNIDNLTPENALFYGGIMLGTGIASLLSLAYAALGDFKE